MSLRSFFNPSPQESARRRQNTFGTEKKSVAAGVIIGGAVLAVAAPLVVTAAGARAAATAVGTFAKANPLKAAVGSFFLPSATVAVAQNPLIVTKTIGGAVNLQSNLIGFAKDPSKKGFIKIGKENPVLASGLALATAFTVGLGPGILNAGNDALNRDATRENTKSIRENTSNEKSLPTKSQLPDTPQPEKPSKNQTAPEVPITRETEVVGREPTLAAKRKRKTKKILSATVVRNTVRVNVLNQNKYIAARNFR